ncbi:hypothetical protein BD626DRAFT_493675 [Schizophyllum amplum]|uniref:Uncharacterized protein n=1 Tax=Schizophyllum amplum TaxID=97359 RepID=A0A550CGY5_9AGAR|nr:hypothetical protein BD626DRAFT_493675 [Auriculariopsis ampla]
MKNIQNRRAGPRLSFASESNANRTESACTVRTVLHVAFLSGNQRLLQRGRLIVPHATPPLTMGAKGTAPRGYLAMPEIISAAISSTRPLTLASPSDPTRPLSLDIGCAEPWTRHAQTIENARRLAFPGSRVFCCKPMSGPVLGHATSCHWQVALLHSRVRAVLAVRLCLDPLFGRCPSEL